MSTSDQKLYTEFSFYLWLRGINSRVKSHLYKPKERFCNQRVYEPKIRRISIADKYRLITYRSGDRKFSQPTITTSHLPQEQKIRNSSASSLFH